MERSTRETRISVDLNIDGTGKFDVTCDIQFLKHMTETLARYAGFDLVLRAEGDNDHHIIEDTAITLGKALRQAMGDAPIERMATAVVPMDDALELYDEAGALPLITPARVNHISHLLFYLFSNLITESKKELRQNSQKLLQQSRISESIQRYKNGTIQKDSYPYDKEKELIARVKQGDVSEANAVLNDLLGYVLFSQGNSLEAVKPRAIELCSLLSRTAIEGGAPTDSILKLNNQFLQNLQQINSMDTLCHKLQEIVETFSESMFNYIPSRNSEIIKKAMLYISDHFNTPLTLEEVAAHVHLHPSYFSTLFKNSTGSAFKEYLNMVRIEESKRLLANTDFSIIDIAVATGFEDQSYFSKVFKKYTGLTPKQYR